MKVVFCVLSSKDDRIRMSLVNKNNIKAYDISVVKDEIKHIYMDTLNA